MYEYLLAVLTWLAADPSELSSEQPRAYAAVAVAMASLEREPKEEEIEPLTNTPESAK